VSGAVTRKANKMEKLGDEEAKTNLASLMDAREKRLKRPLLLCLFHAD
jgi:hypothetical protein